MTDFNRSESMRADSAVSGVAPGSAVATSVLREAEAWTSAQWELLSGMGALWTDWLQRQRETIDASSRSFQQIVESRDLADIAHIQQQWLADTARRGASDINTLACDSVALALRIAGPDRFGVRDRSSQMRGTGRAKSGDEAPLQRAAAE
jgi:hypothetical protein